MPNPRHQKPSPARVNPGTPAAANTPRVTQKPAWPSASVPGPTQPRDRSLGVRKLKQSPKQIGV